MDIDLLSILKEIPLTVFIDFGYVINYSDIYQSLTPYGLDDEDLLNSELKKLADKGDIELLYIDNMLYAVRLK